MLIDPVVVYRSARRAACDERAFVLTAVLIANEIVEVDGQFALCVGQREAAHAAHHLHHYDEERQRPRPKPPPLNLHPNAWRGALVYVLLLLGVAIAAGQHWFTAELFDVGVANSTAMRAGQWWRAWTALTLHWDLEHLLGNLGAGAVFGYFAAQQLGNGRAWLLITLGAGIANLIESTLVSDGYISAGASTAVFATVGLIAAHAWRQRRAFVLPGWRRIAPLIGGVLLLAWLGTEGEHTDVLSHGLGFACGAALGALCVSRIGATWLERIPQRWAAGVAVGMIALCWMLALR
jgi:membrane associated rhomboid family serine protease